MSASNVNIYIGGIRLPVVEPTFQIENPHDNQEQQIVGFGGINLIGKRKLTSFSYSSFYPSKYDRSYCQMQNLLKPKLFVQKILNIKNTVNKTRLIVTKYGINGIYTIEAFNWSADEGTDDINYSIQMREYRLPTLKMAQYNFDVYNFSYTKETRETQKQIYIVQEGETLTYIAAKFNVGVDVLLGDNKQITNPAILPTGTQLLIRGSQINENDILLDQEDEYDYEEEPEEDYEEPEE